jgi:hypothetical protein
MRFRSPDIISLPRWRPLPEGYFDWTAVGRGDFSAPSSCASGPVSGAMNHNSFCLWCQVEALRSTLLAYFESLVQRE